MFDACFWRTCTVCSPSVSKLWLPLRGSSEEDLHGLGEMYDGLHVEKLPSGGTSMAFIPGLPNGIPNTNTNIAKEPRIYPPETTINTLLPVGVYDGLAC